MNPYSAPTTAPEQPFNWNLFWRRLNFILSFFVFGFGGYLSYLTYLAVSHDNFPGLLFSSALVVFFGGVLVILAFDGGEKSPVELAINNYKLREYQFAESGLELCKVLQELPAEQLSEIWDTLPESIRTPPPE